ncbi:MAG: fatty acid CoA ligase FadD21 [Mycobacterium sp.]|jgi:acyl-CoA synthetase (AMP-forming)/AMP-acid ligase II|nr:fatty acid CoA ligase FadD21 [Mycobacterium sp.]
MTQSSLPALLQERASQEPHATTYTSEGAVFIVGRMKDLLIVYGRNDYPEDIEATVKEHGRPGRGHIAQRRQERRHLGDIQVARSERRGPRTDTTPRVDSDHDERQDQTRPTDTAAARIPVWRFRDGHDRGSGRVVRPSAQAFGVAAVHLAQRSDCDRRAGCAGLRGAGHERLRGPARPRVALGVSRRPPRRLSAGAPILFRRSSTVPCPCCPRAKAGTDSEPTDSTN